MSRASWPPIRRSISSLQPSLKPLLWTRPNLTPETRLPEQTSPDVLCELYIDVSEEHVGSREIVWCPGTTGGTVHSAVALQSRAAFLKLHVEMQSAAGILLHTVARSAPYSTWPLTASGNMRSLVCLAGIKTTSARACRDLGLRN
jgi:hypothetical protein